MLDGELSAHLADTGFAKMDTPDASHRSQSNAVYLTKGYLDPIIGQVSTQWQGPDVLSSVRPAQR